MRDNDKHFIALIERSPDRGGGWRDVSKAVWPLVDRFGAQDLLEIDADNMRVRLNSDGLAVARHL